MIVSVKTSLKFQWRETNNKVMQMYNIFNLRTYFYLHVQTPKAQPYCNIDF